MNLSVASIVAVAALRLSVPLNKDGTISLSLSLSRKFAVGHDLWLDISLCTLHLTKSTKLFQQNTWTL